MHERWRPLIALLMVVIDLVAAVVVSIPIFLGAAVGMIAWGDLAPTIEHPLARRVEWRLDEPLDAAEQDGLRATLADWHRERGVAAQLSIIERDGATVVIARYPPGEPVWEEAGERLLAEAPFSLVHDEPLWATRRSPDPENMRWWVETLGWGVVLVLAATSIALFVVALTVRRLRWMTPWEAPESSLPWRIAFGFAYGLLAIVVVAGLGLLAALLGVEQEEQGWVLAAVESGPLGRIALALVGVVAAPLAEELFFRGYAFRYLSTHASRLTAYLGSALLFGLMHFHPVALPTYVAYGLVLAWAYERTRSLLVPVIAHALVNTIAVAQLTFAG